MKRWNDNLVLTVPIFLYLFDFIVFNVIIQIPIEFYICKTNVVS